MLLYNVTIPDAWSALRRVNDHYEGNIIFNGEPRLQGGAVRCTLRVRDSKGAGARVGLSGRRLVSACWHVHGYFMDALPPKARIVTSFGARAPLSPWVDRNIGSVMWPLMASEACYCLSNGY